MKTRKRRRSDLIIRLIDVVLILLFGFIAISEVSKKSKIKLAESRAVPVAAPDRETVVYIGVLPDHRFLVEDETMVIDRAEELSRYIAEKQRQFDRKNVQLRVRVRANHDAEVLYAFTVVNICQDLQIPVGLDVVKKNRG
jgi:biopolymer transport protein ExbD